MIMNSTHIISCDFSLLDALKILNEIKSQPMVLFVVDGDNRMVGTLTDGDIRRALIRGVKVSDKVSEAMFRDFKFLIDGCEDNVVSIRNFKKQKINLLPVLDKDGFIVDIIDLDRFVSRLPVDAVLMAGGKGERLRPLTLNTPKPLIKVGDKCIIDYNVERLINYGIKNINVTVNYLAEQIEEHFANPVNGIKVNTVRENVFLGTIGSVRFIEHFENDTVLVMNSDLFTNIDYESFFLHFCQHNADMSVAAIPYNINIPFGVFELDGRDIKGVKEKPTYHYYANAGIYLLKKSILEHIPKDTFFNATDLMEKLISLDRKVIRFPLTGYWIDIGQHSELKKAEELVRHV